MADFIKTFYYRGYRFEITTDVKQQDFGYSVLIYGLSSFPLYIGSKFADSIVATKAAKDWLDSNFERVHKLDKGYGDSEVLDNTGLIEWLTV